MILQRWCANSFIRKTFPRRSGSPRMAFKQAPPSSRATAGERETAAIVARSHACQRWLSLEPPNIERAKVTAEGIIRDANSAADVVSRIRALFRQAEQHRSPEDVNHLIREVCRLMADEIAAKDTRV